MIHRLYYKDVFVGTVQIVHAESFYLEGLIDPAPVDGEVRRFVEFLTQDQPDLPDDVPFSDDIQMPEHWRLVDENGVSRRMSMPCIRLYESSITWRWA